MKFTYNWLKQYIELDWSPQELADRLTFAGIEVESLETTGSKIPDEIVVAQILASDKHPNADKLTVCRVHDGQTERQIVCGAKNYKVGDKVPCCLPGATLPGGITIREAKLRGIVSQGMMCSAEELGLPKGEDGLLILPADAPVGAKFADYIGAGDTVFDIEVTPNRPDWLSIIGIAREVAALSGRPLRLPDIRLTESTESVEKFATVRVDAPELCPRYTARVIRGVRVGPSPSWLRQLLEKVGLRSINNVVDVTNYVLLECGHPLHAFDYQLLKGKQIIVRRAENGERFVAIDDSRHELTPEMLVIADAERPVALAGIMGGKNSEINDATTDVLLESAYFHPPCIRRTSKRLGLVTESSYRFERGTDIEGLVFASNRAASLIQQLAGGELASGIIDVLAKPIRRRRLTCRYAQLRRLLGIELPPETAKKIFVSLGLSITRDDPTSCELEVPTFRVDLEQEADLIEEVCRIYGVEKIPAALQPATAQVSDHDAEWDARRQIRQVLTALGFHEAMNQTMVPAELPTTSPGTPPSLKLQNPLSADMAALRASLIPGLLANLRTNISRQQYDVRLFEIGRVFDAEGREHWKLALAATGRRNPGDWQCAEKIDYFDIKGALEELGLTAQIHEIPAAVARKMDLRDPVYLAEVDLPPPRRAEKQFKELPRFPSVVRDMALVVPEQLRHADILAAIEKCRTKHLESVELFDIFRGGPIPAGKKSMAYSLTFRADRTLTDAEVNAEHEQMKRQLRELLPCEIRES
ncbi:MAG: phenylalanine--tRNA ligase subunit beta [Verrucomicrobiae bacterium]|nr:phenylalanine--tRNA ligase subunit beta [Verrucomicrobiae bacterium]